MGDEEAKVVTMSNTKKEILAAYNQLLDQYKQRKKQSLDAAEKIQEIKDKKVIEVAQSLSTEKVVMEIGDLKAEIGALLGQVADRLEAEVAKFEAIQRAIEAKNAELKDIYGIEKEAGSLAALIDTQRQKRQELESEMAELRAKLESEISRTREEWEKEKREHADSVAERNVEEKRQRLRAKEEFEYEFEKEKRRAQDQFEEEKARLQNELKVQREELAQREEAVAAREQELSELRQRAEAFPAELAAAVQAKVSESREQLQKEAKAREELLTKEFEGERNVLLTRIDGLEKTIKEQAQQIGRLSQTQDKAYQQVQQIAFKAVEGAGNMRSLVQTVAAESAKRKGQEE